MTNMTYNKANVFIAACAGMTFFGISMLSLGPILQQLKEVVGDSANMLPTTLSVGIIIGTMLFGPIVDKFGYKTLLILSSISTLIGLQGLSNGENLVLLHSAMLFLGLGGGILNGETNALVSDIYNGKGRGIMLSLLGAFYCIGALSWTLLNVYIPIYEIPLNGISVLMAIFIIYFCIINFPKPEPKVIEGNAKQSVFSLLKYPVLFVFSLILFFQCGFEGITGNFTPSYLKGLDIENDITVLSLTWFTIGMLIGRLILSVAMAKLSETTTLYIYLTIAIIGVLMLWLQVESTIIIFTAMAFIGFGVGATFPVVLNFIGNTFRQMPATAFSLALFIGLCGQFSFNYFIGIMAKNGGIHILPILQSSQIIIMMILLAVALKMYKIK